MASTRSTRRPALLGAAALVAVGLIAALAASLGGPEEPEAPPEVPFTERPAAEILAQGIAELRAVESFSFHAEDSLGTLPVDIDARIDRAGRCAGRLVMDLDEDRDRGKDEGAPAAATFIADGPVIFLKGNARFWRKTNDDTDGDILQVLNGRWARVTDTTSGPAMCDLDHVLDRVGAHADNLRVVRFEHEDSERRAVLAGDFRGAFIRAFVDAGEPHYLRGYEIWGGRRPEVARFSDLGDTRPIRLPESGDYLDLGGSELA